MWGPAVSRSKFGPGQGSGWKLDHGGGSRDSDGRTVGRSGDQAIGAGWGATLSGKEPRSAREARAGLRLAVCAPHERRPLGRLVGPEPLEQRLRLRLDHDGLAVRLGEKAFLHRVIEKGRER